MGNKVLSILMGALTHAIKGQVTRLDADQRRAQRCLYLNILLKRKESVQRDDIFRADNVIYEADGLSDAVPIDIMG